MHVDTTAKQLNCEVKTERKLNYNLERKTEMKRMQATWVPSFGLADNALDGKEREERVTTLK